MKQCHYSLSIHAFHSIFCVSGILKLHKGKPGWVPCHPDSSQGAIVTECSLQLPLGSTITQVTHIHFTVSGPRGTTRGGVVRHLSAVGRWGVVHGDWYFLYENFAHHSTVSIWQRKLKTFDIETHSQIKQLILQGKKHFDSSVFHKIPLNDQDIKQ